MIAAAAAACRTSPVMGAALATIPAITSLVHRMMPASCSDEVQVCDVLLII
jgi:hypothetical protein